MSLHSSRNEMIACNKKSFAYLKEYNSIFREIIRQLYNLWQDISKLKLFSKDYFTQKPFNHYLMSEQVT